MITNYTKILKEMSLYGKSFLCGSAKKGMEFINRHDVDIGLFTELKSECFLIERCSSAILEYERDVICPLPLHFILIGDFESKFERVKPGEMKHLVQFVPRKYRYLIWLKIVLIKWKKSQLKKS